MESFNPQVLPSSLSKKDHHRSAKVALWAVVGTIIIGISYWAIANTRKVDVTPPLSTPPAKTAAELRQEITESVKDSPATITKEEIMMITASVSKSKSTETSEQRAEITRQLKSN